MKLRAILFIFSFLIVFGCSSQKDMNQRRNLMIPQKDELPRNSKYSSSKKKKTYHPVKKKNKKPKKKNY
jgi:hypothetical protein